MRKGFVKFFGAGMLALFLAAAAGAFLGDSSASAGEALFSHCRGGGYYNNGHHWHGGHCG